MFISYSQNLEDLILYKALLNITNGIYIDVGANDPIIDSVTKAFYDRGWTGINIEPIVSNFNLLNQERKNDINLNLAIGNINNKYIFNTKIRGLSTCNTEIIKKYQRDGFEGEIINAQFDTLDNIIFKYKLPEIHFLKIDVEGYEYQVLTTIDLSRYRPWIIVIEALEPNSVIENYFESEKYILFYNYKFAYFDGLNRYYLANERNHLLVNFKFPPNINDNFLKYREILLLNKINDLEKEINDLQKKNCL
jgi:FkbM family methyltransferase